MNRQYKILIIALLSLTVLIVSCSDLKKDLPTATPEGSQIHGNGWVEKTSTNFHGITIKNANWDMTSCKKCHGPDYKGGSSGASCLTCHNTYGGPENCSLCHGNSTNSAPPKDLSGNLASSARIGAHQSHLLGDTIFATISCNECHIVPSSFKDTTHIDADGRAEIRFRGSVVTSSLASLAGSDVAAYISSTNTCSNTYCHGYFPNGNKQAVSWDNATGQAKACGSCHGDVSKSTLADKALPKTSLVGGTHPNDNRCYTCHPTVINSSNKIINISKHLNGKIDF